MVRVSEEEYPGIESVWKMVAEYEDGTRLYIFGEDEDVCMCEIAEREEKYGSCIYYSGCSDEDYVGGEYIGRDNFIYD